MRVVLIAAVFAALLIATEASMMQNPFELHKHHRMVEGARALQKFQKKMLNFRKFDKQQATADPICQTAEAATVLTDALTKCTGPLTEIMGLTTTVESEITAAYDAFCSGECMALLTGMNPAYVPCFPADAQGFLTYSQFMCRKENNKYCGAVMSSMGSVGNCDMAYTETSCSAAGSMCSWNANTKDCDTVVTNTMLDGICSPCLDAFLQNFGGPNGVLGPDASMGVEMLKLTMCSKVDGQFCYPMVQNILNSDADFGDYTQTQMDSICADKKVFVCLRKVVQGGFAAMRPMMDKMFLSCVDQCQKDARCVENSCKRSYSQFAMGMKQMEPMLGALCLQNPRNQKYCFAKIEDGGCGDTVFYPGTCNATCDASLKTLLDEMGCCLGTMQQMMFTPPQPLGPNDFPMHTVTGTVGPTPAPWVSPTSAPLSLPPAGAFETVDGEAKIENPAPGGLEAFGICPSLSDIKTRLSYHCVIPTSKPIRKELKVKIAYSAVQADPALKTQLVGALKQDTAVAIGVSPAEIQNADLVEDASVTVTTASSRMRTLATGSGSKFVFDIVTSDDAIAATAAAEFDTQVTSNSMVLASTQSTVTTGCTTGCTPASGGLVAGGSTSGAASITMMAAALVAIIAALL